MAEGEFALVRHHLEVALHVSHAEHGDHDLYAALADAAACQRDEAALQQYAPPAEELALRHGHLLYQAVAHRSWGIVHRLAGDYIEAESRLTRALESFRALDTRWQIGRTLYELGELAVARSDLAAARDYFSQSRSAFDAMRAAPDAARVRAAFDALA